MAVALIFSIPFLYTRSSMEWSSRSVAVIVDYRDIVSLANQASTSREEVIASARRAGALGITAAELTGRDLVSGALPLVFSPLGSVDPLERVGVDASPDLGALTVDSSDPMLPQMMEYLRVRMPGVRKHVPGKKTLIILPIPFSELLDSGVLLDFEAMDFAAENDLALIYRPVPASYLNSDGIVRSLSWIGRHYPALFAILPAGNAVVGNPDLAPIADAMKELGVVAAHAEFVRQTGMDRFVRLMDPQIVPLHSITREEVISRNISRSQIVERMIRSVHERSIRLLLFRPYDLYSTGRLQPFLDDIASIHEGLSSRGYVFALPRTFSRTSYSLLSAIALAIVFFACLLSYVRRMRSRSDLGPTRSMIIAFAVLSIVMGLLIWKVSIVSRLIGGLAAALIATEATIQALDRYLHPADGLVIGIATVLTGGLVIASFYGISDAMLRLKTFSGVSLTLMLPPLLVLISDIVRRIHPEPVMSILRRPPVWGELLIVGALGLAALVMLVRSGNTGFVADWEVALREMLERLLWVRPRTKEFAIGYPCLIIYYSLIRSDVFPKYRELFRVGASISFASAINTFCHFHTLLPITIVRVVNGWWLGISIGVLILMLFDWIVYPIWKRASARTPDEI